MLFIKACQKAYHPNVSRTHEPRAYSSLVEFCKVISGVPQTYLFCVGLHDVARHIHLHSLIFELANCWKLPTITAKVITPCSKVGGIGMA